MKRVGLFLLAVAFFFGVFSAEAFAQENMGLGDKASRQLSTKGMGNVLLKDNVNNVLLRDTDRNILSERGEKSSSRIRISRVTCIHKVITKDQLVHVYDQNGQVSLMRIPSQELSIRVPCPKE